MTLNDAYRSYIQRPDPGTLNSLFASVSLYASRLASMNLSAPDRDDAAQEAVVAVWTRLGKYDPVRGKFTSWVQCRILSAFSDYRRKGRAQKRGAGWQHVTLADIDL